jgi:hypothetical protein
MLSVCVLAIGEQPSSPPASAAQVKRDYGRLPMSFEANRGQTAGAVKFLARGSGYGLFLTGQEAVLTLHAPTGAATAVERARLKPFGLGLHAPGTSPAADRGEQANSGAAARWTTDVVRMQLAGANAKVEPVGVERLPGSSSYFLGNDPAKWRSDIPSFAKVRYAGVYPGVDLVYYGNQRQLEYDFVVAPGATSDLIRLKFEGAKKLELDPDGNLSIAAGHGDILFQKPVLYQTIQGRQVRVDGDFRLMANHSVGFRVGNYDHSQPLVIDPILAYSTYFGGTASEFVVAVTADAAGNAYVTGLTVSEDFPLTAGAFQAVNYASGANAVSTAFISKFNASGTALLYSTYLGGVAIANTLHEQGDYGKAIAVDAAGNAYLTGYTYSSDFPITSGAFQKGNQAASIGLATGFVSKLNPSGTGLVYSTYLGGNVLDELTALAIDTAGDAYISGVTFSSNYPTTSGAFQAVNKSASANGFNDVVTKLNPTGSALIYSTYLGGGSSDGSALSNIYWTNPIAIDKEGNAYIGGFTTSGDFPVTAGVFQPVSHASGYAVTVSKLNPTGSALVYSTYLGGSTSSVVEGLAIDAAGNVYVAGFTSDMDFPVTKGAFQTVNHADTSTSDSAESNQNGFVSKINPTGSALVYSTYLGGTTGPWGGDQVYDLAVDSAGDAYVAGSAMSDDFPVTANAFQSKNKGATHCCDYLTYTSNGFLTEFNPTGTGLLYSTYLGGSGTQNPVGAGGSGDTAYGLGLGPNGNVYVVGFTTSPNFPLTTGAFQTAYHTQQNTGFVADFDLGAAPTSKESETTLTASADSVTPGTAVTFTATVTPVSGTVIPTGSIVFSVDEATVATIALTGGKATYTNSTLVAGQHYVLASYGGSTSYEASGDGFNEIVAPAKPVISLASGTYYAQQSVSITDGTANSPLYYTLDGSTPSVFSTVYTAPIVVSTTKTVSVVAVAEHDATSAEVSAAYTIVGSPNVLAGPATAVGTTGATLSAYVNTNGVAGSYSFHYGTATTALTTATATTALVASATRATASAALTGLKASTKYYYQVVVTTAGGMTAGAVGSFTTN